MIGGSVRTGQLCGAVAIAATALVAGQVGCADPGRTGSSGSAWSTESSENTETTRTRGTSEAGSVAQQEQQLEEFIDAADGWGEEVLGLISEAEIDEIFPNSGGVGYASALAEEWPRYYVWQRVVVLAETAQHSPARTAELLEPGLQRLGWEPSSAPGFPPGEWQTLIDYVRPGYSLAVEVYTEPPPRIQKIGFSIVSPITGVAQR